MVDHKKVEIAFSNTNIDWFSGHQTTLIVGGNEKTLNLIGKMVVQLGDSIEQWSIQHNRSSDDIEEIVDSVSEYESYHIVLHDVFKNIISPDQLWLWTQLEMLKTHGELESRQLFVIIPCIESNLHSLIQTACEYNAADKVVFVRHENTVSDVLIGTVFDSNSDSKQMGSMDYNLSLNVHLHGWKGMTPHHLGEDEFSSLIEDDRIASQYVFGRKLFDAFGQHSRNLPTEPLLHLIETHAPLMIEHENPIISDTWRQIDKKAKHRNTSIKHVRQKVEMSGIDWFDSTKITLVIGFCPEWASAIQEIHRLCQKVGNSVCVPFDPSVDFDENTITNRICHENPDYSVIDARLLYGMKKSNEFLWETLKRMGNNIEGQLFISVNTNKSHWYDIIEEIHSLNKFSDEEFFDFAHSLRVVVVEVDQWTDNRENECFVGMIADTHTDCSSGTHAQPNAGSAWKFVDDEDVYRAWGMSMLDGIKNLQLKRPHDGKPKCVEGDLPKTAEWDNEKSETLHWILRTMYPTKLLTGSGKHLLLFDDRPSVQYHLAHVITKWGLTNTMRDRKSGLRELFLELESHLPRLCNQENQLVARMWTEAKEKIEEKIQLAHEYNEKMEQQRALRGK